MNMVYHGLAINNMPPLKWGCQDDWNFGALSLSAEKPAGEFYGFW